MRIVQKNHCLILKWNNFCSNFIYLLIELHIIRFPYSKEQTDDKKKKTSSTTLVEIFLNY
jgi:hypothetical protein